MREQELKIEFVEHSMLILHPLRTTALQNSLPVTKFLLIKCFFQQPASDRFLCPDLKISFVE